MAAKNESNELVISRLLDAPRQLVWQSMTNPHHVVQWWGPRGFKTTTEIMDVRPGGRWDHVMHGPDGTNYPNRAVFQEIDAPARLVYSNRGGRNSDTGIEFTATWTFEELEANKTRVTIRMVFATPAERNRIVDEFGALEGGKQCLERLAEHLPSMNAGEREFVVTRFLSATPAQAFKAWTDPNQMSQWWGPQNFTNPVCDLDVCPNGSWRIVMRAPDGQLHPAHGVYREIVEPRRIVMTIDHSELSNEWHDMVNPTRDQSKGKPKIEGIMTVTFEEADGKTKLTIRTQFESAEVLNSLKRIGMNQGWSQSLERLTAVLANA